MQDFPHHYRARVEGSAEGEVPLESSGPEKISTAPPKEFGGPGDRWSPETLLVGAVADCFLFTFRAVARASKLEWSRLACDVTGTLDREEGKPRFTRLDVQARLAVPKDTDVAKARRVLEKAEQSCLVTNSLRAESHLESNVDVEG